MPRHLFDTGFLTVDVSATLMISAGAEGTVAGATTSPVIPIGNSPAKTFDGDSATQFLMGGDTGGYNFLRIDLGSAQTVTNVTLLNVTTTGGAVANVRCYVSNTASLANPATGTQLGTAQPIGATVNFVGSATGRYLYFSPTAVTAIGSWSIGEVRATANQSIQFAVLQSIEVSAGFTAAALSTTVLQTAFPIDVAYHSGEITLDAKHAEITPGALAKLVGTDVVQGPTFSSVSPVSAGFSLPAMSGVFVGQDSNGKEMRLRCPRLYAPGVKLDFALGQFATEGAQFKAYLDGTTDVVASWEFEN